MWIVNFVIMRDGERSRDDGSPRFLNSNAPFPVPDIDQMVVHRGEMFVVDDVVWDLERKTVFVEIAPAEEPVKEMPATSSSNADDMDVEDSDDIEIEDADAESDDSGSDDEPSSS